DEMKRITFFFYKKRKKDENSFSSFSIDLLRRQLVTISVHAYSLLQQQSSYHHIWHHLTHESLHLINGLRYIADYKNESLSACFQPNHYCSSYNEYYQEHHLLTSQ